MTETQKPKATATVEKPTVQLLSEALDRITVLETALQKSTPEGQLAEANAKIAALEAQQAPSIAEQLAAANAKIAELSAKPAVEPTSTSTEDSSFTESSEPWMQLGIQKKAMAMRSAGS